MIASLKGNIENKGSNFIVVDVNGVGYKAYMPSSSIQDLNVGDKIKIYTYLRMSQDDMSLFGFLTNEELAMFELLISVGGIGAKSATNILSNIEPSTFAMAVIMSDVNKIKSLPGIGPKTAQRIILELKDKIKNDQAIDKGKGIAEKIELTQVAEDAIDALQVLGYNRRDVEQVMSKIDTTSLTLEDAIKEGLKNLSK